MLGNRFCQGISAIAASISWDQTAGNGLSTCGPRQIWVDCVHQVRVRDWQYGYMSDNAGIEDGDEVHTSGLNVHNRE